MRLFVAIAIQLSTKSINELSKLKSELGGYNIKWVRPENLHITLHFIGETKLSQIESIRLIISEILSSKQAFALKIKGIGTFGKSKQARIIWLDIMNNEKLTKIATEINKQLSYNGFGEKMKNYKAHLTIGRINFCNLALISRLEELKEKYKNYGWEDKFITSIKLYQSVLIAHKPIYKIIQTFQLNN